MAQEVRDLRWCQAEDHAIADGDGMKHATTLIGCSDLASPAEGFSTGEEMAESRNPRRSARLAVSGNRRNEWTTKRNMKRNMVANAA
jgi:hypothetical protein